jgi:hypothetical protein
LARALQVERGKGGNAMNAKQIGLALLLADFSALTAYALYQYGLVGFFQIMGGNAATLTALADLTISLGIVLVWMWNDARVRNAAFLPYAVVTLFLGSVGPLLYLIVRFGDERATRRHALEPAAARTA